MSVDLDKLTERADELWETSILPSLSEFIEIEALSPGFEPDWKNKGELDSAIDLFSKRPGGNYVLYLIMLLYERNIECTEETQHYYIPSNICSPSTLSNIIKESIVENYIKKQQSKAHHRSKNFIHSQST